MGDIADMVLEGQMCQTCGEILGNGNGFPTFCSSCKAEQNRSKQTQVKKVACPICNKKVKPAGLEMHKRDVHGESQ